MCIPGTNFGPKGKITYIGEGDDKAKFCEYFVHVLSYVNSIKSDNPNLPAAYAGGRVNCYATLPTVLTVVFNKESSTFASGRSEGTVKVWNYSTGSCQHTLGGYP